MLPIPPNVPPPHTEKLDPTPKKSSTFRRLPPPRTRPPEPQSRVPSVTRQFDRSPPPPRSPSLHSHAPSIDQSPSHSSLATDIQLPPQPPPASISSSLSPSPLASPPVSLPSTPPRSSAPYRPGFQPRGVYRPRTDEFSQARKANHDATRIERTKLERRLEKLIHLHFPLQDNESNDTKNTPLERRKSTFFDFDLANLKNMDASDFWKGVVHSQALQGAKGDIRGLLSPSHSFVPHPLVHIAAEQRIAPWQEDAAVAKCPLCK